MPFELFKVPEYRIIILDGNEAVLIALDFYRDEDERKRRIYDSNWELQCEIQRVIIAVVRYSWEEKLIIRGKGYKIHTERSIYGLRNTWLFGRDGETTFRTRGFKYLFWVEFCDYSSKLGRHKDVVRISSPAMTLSPPPDSLSNDPLSKYAHKYPSYSYSRSHPQPYRAKKTIQEVSPSSATPHYSHYLTESAPDPNRAESSPNISDCDYNGLGLRLALAIESQRARRAASEKAKAGARFFPAISEISPIRRRVKQVVSTINSYTQELERKDRRRKLNGNEGVSGGKKRRMGSEENEGNAFERGRHGYEVEGKHKASAKRIRGSATTFKPTLGSQRDGSVFGSIWSPMKKLFNS
ncbi:uncharacterized protein VTP21DRAFT_10527 [Calcarisporiella thermophila]|uniref:uncharacterized protein n=1 Tax=Calcarisporiella thermophila TaxID=911321 RepID=UPI00374321DD